MSKSGIKEKRRRIREAAEADLETFIKLVAPYRVLGDVHKEMIQWWTRQDGKTHQLALIPRDHGKSALIAYRVAWMLAKDPTIRVLYISATSNLAEKQLKFIKDILTSSAFMEYWPDHVNPDEGKREKWTNSEIILDHPKRKTEGVRDSSVFAGGLTTGLTGLHCDIAVMDDVVVYENAYTEEGRRKVRTQCSLLTSIASVDASVWIVGTRYHPNDYYQTCLDMEEDLYNDDGEIIGGEPVYEVFQRQVESVGDGTGEFLWPRQQRSDGKWFGFDRAILAKKRAQYTDRVQFRAQYYNDPMSSDGTGISREKFQYYDQQYVTRKMGKWFFKDKRLNVYAAIDLAFSVSRRADYTALVVVGVNPDNQVYVLDIERFQTENISDIFRRLLTSHLKWDFRKLRAEVGAAQKAIVKELKNNYIVPNGLALSVDEFVPHRHLGSKEERLDAILRPRYDNLSVWHYRGGNCQVLEDELISINTAHDDVKDALASAIDISIPPANAQMITRSNNIVTHPRFGGVA